MGEKLTIGILAHVDAGKTTLSESILYLTGVTRKQGRVDHKNAFLDHDEIERNRGITVFAKEARFVLGEKQVTMLDTPGHGDFSSEAERVLQVLDYAILVISGTDGVQSHTQTLWRLLEAYEVPTWIFVNKMDRPETDRAALLSEIRKTLGGVSAVGSAVFADFGRLTALETREEIGSASEALLETFLADALFADSAICDAITARQLFPVCFGSALKGDGVQELLTLLGRYTNGYAVHRRGDVLPSEEEGNGDTAPFGARVYKISRDKKGNRLTHLKVTSGILKSKMEIAEGQKAEQLRLYQGEKFELVQRAAAGEICAVLGPTATYAGQGLGCEEGSTLPLLEPTLTYQLRLPEGEDPVVAMRKLRELGEEEPTLHLTMDAERGEIHVQVMGELELEILRELIARRFAMQVTFDSGTILYKETIAAPVLGIGHYEPLRHYAEVQLLLEPLPRGSGLVFDSLVSEDALDRNWQRLILTHLAEKPHRGVLTGAEITDLRISIAAGKAHLKHTEGGDFRQATYRAVRQGLRKAESVLLEPVVRFRMELPTENTGRALTELERFGAQTAVSESDGETTVLTGLGPVAALKDYPKELLAYTRGKGSMSTMPAGYQPCHNQEEIVAAAAYLPEQDLENPTGSVFCSHGAAVYVNWDEVDAAAHLDGSRVLAAAERRFFGGEDDGSQLDDDACGADVDAAGKSVRQGGAGSRQSGQGSAASAKELEDIFFRTYGRSKRDEALYRESRSRGTKRPSAGENFPQPKWKRDGEIDGSGGKAVSDAPMRPLYVIDGYNVLFAWEEFAALAKVNLDSAREALLDVLQNYQGYKKIDMLVVFDGYKLAGNPGTRHDYEKLSADAGSFRVVYTREAETADRYIEKAIYAQGRRRALWVVTSDQPVQMAALGDGAARFSAREFYAEVAGTSAEIRGKLAAQRKERNLPFQDVF